MTGHAGGLTPVATGHGGDAPKGHGSGGEGHRGVAHGRAHPEEATGGRGEA